MSPIRLALLLLAAGTLPAGAQQNAAVKGRVMDGDGNAVAVATIRVAGTGAVAFSDSAGRFLLVRLPAGEHVVEVSGFGMATRRIVGILVAGDTIDLQVRLEADPLPADPLLAEAEAYRMPPQMQGFHDRRARGGGYFFTRADLERMQVYQFTDVLRRVPGMYLQLVEGPYGIGYLVQMRRTSGAGGPRGCPVLFFINGTPFPVSPDVGIDQFVRPEDVSGVEVYSGAARLPPQFSSTPNNSRCGVVAIWTHPDRRADEPRRR